MRELPRLLNVALWDDKQVPRNFAGVTQQHKSMLVLGNNPTLCITKRTVFHAVSFLLVRFYAHTRTHFSTKSEN